MTMTKKLEKLLKDTILEDIDFYEVDFKSADEAIEYIQERIAEEEIIYHSKAMDYLMENDTSLQYSLELAHNCGYEVKNLNSELLATLLYQDNLTDKLSDLTKEIEEIFS